MCKKHLLNELIKCKLKGFPIYFIELNNTYLIHPAIFYRIFSVPYYNIYIILTYVSILFKEYVQVIFNLTAYVL